jgi:hypothetical protein
MGKEGEEQNSKEKENENDVSKIFRTNRRTNEEVLWKVIRKREKKLCSMRNRKIGIWWSKIYLYPARMQSNDITGGKRRALTGSIN